MKLTNTPYKIRCEMGVCKNFASKSIISERVGIRSNLHVCSQCLIELYKLIGATVIPSSIETLAKKGRSKKIKDD